MKRLLWLLAVATPALSQALPEPQPMRAVVVSVDLPPVYSGVLEVHAVLIVEEGDGARSTLYMPYFGPGGVPQPGQRCAFDIGPGFAKGLVGRENWSKGRHVTALLHADCEAKG